MSDIAEGIGGAIEGAIAGRAVEPAHGEPGAKTSETEPSPCPNCGFAHGSTFCPECGQKSNVHRSLSAILHDLIHGVLHLDGKFWKTIPLLVFKPGKLTRRYIDGERAKFVSPMAMFLFSVFAMFAIFQVIGLSAPTDFEGAGPVEGFTSQAGVQAERLREQIEARPEGDPDRARLENELRGIEELLAAADSQLGVAGAEPPAADTTTEPTTGPDAESSSVPNTFDVGDTNVEMNVTGIDAIDQGIIKKWRENPGLMIYKMQANAYKFSWLLIPLSVPFIWPLFAWKHRFRAYDHAVFVTYSLGFMSLLFIAASLLAVAGAPAQVIAITALLVPPIHIYMQLRGTYELSRFGSLWRLALIMLFIMIITILFLQILLLLGAF